MAKGDADEVSGRLWLTGRVSVVVEEAVGHGVVDLWVGLVDGASVGEVRAAVPPGWTVDEVDDEPERAAVASALRASAGPVRAGRRVVVVPPGEAPDGAGDELDVVVTVDPGAAFGSGSHATTRMAVAALEQEVGEGSRVLDVGSGTGVLSIVAARLGAASVVAVDVDDEAVRVTTANVARNEVAERVVVVEAVDRVDRTAPFDVVVANVSAGVLVELAPAILAVLADDGVALLTGILDERAAEVEAAWTDAAGGRVVTRRASEDGWTLLEVHLPVGQ